MSWQHDPAVGHTKGLTLEGAREIYVLILGSDWLHLCVSEKSQINKPSDPMVVLLEKKMMPTPLT